MSSLKRLAAAGQSVWLDTLSRPLIHGGELDRLVRDFAVSGATTNPTILEHAVASSSAYDVDIALAARAGADAGELVLSLIVPGVRDACDRFAALYRASDGIDGFVSLEVDPALADDAAGTVEAALRLRSLVDRPNLYVKIPATVAGVATIEETVAHGVPVNVTLLFGLDRHRAAAEAYARGLDRWLTSGGDAARVPSVASFFVSRVDTETDARLAEVGAPAELSGQLAIANAKLAYRTSCEVFSGPTWEALETHGARPQRCLWASTSTKDPRYRDVRDVEELIGPGTVSTMPPITLAAFADHGRVDRTLDRRLDEAEQAFADVAAAGIDYDDVTHALETEGIRRFVTSWTALLDRLTAVAA
jgi:transaldolase